MLTIEEVQATRRIWGVRHKHANTGSVSGVSDVFRYEQCKHTFKKYKRVDVSDIRVINQDDFLGRIILGLDYFIQNGKDTPSQRQLMRLLGIRSLGYLREGLVVLERLGAISVEKIPLTYDTKHGVTASPNRFRCRYVINVTYRRI